jgi:Kef-type K+ transport system membrane component KefB
MLVGLFFVTVGMQVDPRAIAASPLQSFLWLALFVFAKDVLAVLAMRVAPADYYPSHECSPSAVP